MTRFETGIILAAIITIPIMSAVYYKTMKELVNYINNGISINAEVILTQTKSSGRSSQCIIGYKYFVKNIEYTGRDSTTETCPHNIRQINIFYIKNKPQESVIGFNIMGLSVPIFLIFIPMLFIGRYRNYNNRIDFCIYNIIACITFMVVASAILAINFLHPIAINDFLSKLLSFIFISFFMLSIFYLYKNIVRYSLYKNGKSINAIITDVKEITFKNSILSYKIYYKYIVGSKKYSDYGIINKKDYHGHKKNEQISVLFHPIKNYISCFNN